MTQKPQGNARKQHLHLNHSQCSCVDSMHMKVCNHVCIAAYIPDVTVPPATKTFEVSVENKPVPAKDYKEGNPRPLI
jgi:hypothetical protein